MNRQEIYCFLGHFNKQSRKYNFIADFAWRLVAKNNHLDGFSISLDSFRLPKQFYFLVVRPSLSQTLTFPRACKRTCMGSGRCNAKGLERSLRLVQSDSRGAERSACAGGMLLPPFPSGARDRDSPLCAMLHCRCFEDEAEGGPGHLAPPGPAVSGLRTCD